MKRLLSCTVNGEKRDLAIDTRQTLLEMLRNGIRLTGTKEGCSNGNCGACTVLLNGHPVDSCMVLAAEVEGQSITTIEGVARDGKLHPLQEAFVADGGLECGFCTPGMIMAAKGLLDKLPRPTEQEVRLHIAGNLCRCTGYDKIVTAIQHAAASLTQR